MHVVKSAKVLFVVAGLCLVSGCSGGAAGPETKQSDIGATAKNSINEFVDGAKRQPAAAAEQLKVLIESLDSYADKHGDQFTVVRDKAKELLTAYGPPLDQAKVNTGLEKLKQESAKLP